MKYFSAFSGIGGFDEEIRRVLLDTECVGYSEINKYAIKIYEKHFPNRINYGDIKQIKTSDLADFDMFCGGFPCQDLSIAGKRAGLEGCRSGLFYEIIRIIQEKKPGLVFLENVKGLFSSDKGRDFARVLLALDGAGYDVEWQLLNSKNFGVPQNRERVFIIGHFRGKPWKPVFPIREGIKGCDKRTEQTTVNTLTAGGHSGGHHSSMTLLQVGGENQGNRIYSTEGLSKCLSDGGGQGAKTGLYQISKTIRTGGRSSPHGSKQNWDSYEIGSQIRRLTPLECERLQGYSDRWTEGISDTQRYKCLGNAVTVNVIEAIMKSIVSSSP